jgi:hypothetical protein
LFVFCGGSESGVEEEDYFSWTCFFCCRGFYEVDNLRDGDGSPSQIKIAAMREKFLYNMKVLISLTLK